MVSEQQRKEEDGTAELTSEIFLQVNIKAGLNYRAENVTRL